MKIKKKKIKAVIKHYRKKMNEIHNFSDTIKASLLEKYLNEIVDNLEYGINKK